MNEAAFDLPDGFRDRTVTYLEGKSPEGTPVALLVQREPFPSGKTLRQVAAAHVNDAKTRLHGYVVLYEREILVDEVPAIDFGVRWRDDTGNVYTRQAHLALDRTLLIVAGEVPFEERERCDTYVDHVLASLRLRD
jgi:hypothetical protein